MIALKIFLTFTLLQVVAWLMVRNVVPFVEWPDWVFNILDIIYYIIWAGLILSALAMIWTLGVPPEPVFVP